MDIQQLKLMAGRVRGLLEQSKHTIGHNQSLDLIAALPGLRNWPEVQAFPDRGLRWTARFQAQAKVRPQPHSAGDPWAFEPLGKPQHSTRAPNLAYWASAWHLRHRLPGGDRRIAC